MSKGQFNLTRGVVSVSASTTQAMERALDVSGIRKAVFAVRSYQIDLTGTLHIESSNQNVDDSDNLWKSLGNVAWTGSAMDSNKLTIVVGDEDELLSYARWRFEYTSGSGAATFEITGYSLD